MQRMRGQTLQILRPGIYAVFGNIKVAHAPWRCQSSSFHWRTAQLQRGPCQMGPPLLQRAPAAGALSLTHPTALCCAGACLHMFSAPDSPDGSDRAPCMALHLPAPVHSMQRYFGSMHRAQASVMDWQQSHRKFLVGPQLE